MCITEFPLPFPDRRGWIAIAEFPDTWTTATVTRTVFQGMAQGAYQRYEMVPLSTPDSVDAAQPAVTFPNLLDE